MLAMVQFLKLVPKTRRLAQAASAREKRAEQRDERQLNQMVLGSSGDEAGSDGDTEDTVQLQVSKINKNFWF